MKLLPPHMGWTLKPSRDAYLNTFYYPTSTKSTAGQNLGWDYMKKRQEFVGVHWEQSD